MHNWINSVAIFAVSIALLVSIHDNNARSRQQHATVVQWRKIVEDAIVASSKNAAQTRESIAHITRALMALISRVQRLEPETPAIRRISNGL